MHNAAQTDTNPNTDPNTNFTQHADPALAQVRAIYRVKRIESEVALVIAQTKALEALMTCMVPLQTTGDAKLDAFHARERNRQRLAATQTLLHVRTVMREKRLRRTTRANPNAKADPDTKAAANAATGGAMVGAEGEDHADNSSPVAPVAPSPLAGEVGSNRSSLGGRMRGQSALTSPHGGFPESVHQPTSRVKQTIAAAGAPTSIGGGFACRKATSR